MQFVDEVHQDMTAFKLALRSRARSVTNQFWAQLEQRSSG
jgi:hypothetical protein